MTIVRIHAYKLVSHPDKGLYVQETDQGWFHIAGKLGEFYGRDNIFASIDELKLVLHEEIEHCWTKDYTPENKNGI